MTFSGTMPDITPVQIAAFAQWIVSQAVAYGWLDTRFSQIVLSATSTLLAFGWTLADAHIRHGRAKVLAAQTPAAIVSVNPAST